MARVLLVGLKHEVNTFVPGVTTLEDFRRRYLLEGTAIFGPARGSGQEIDGILQVAKEKGIELVPTVAAYGGASRRVQDSAYAFICDRAVARARQERERLDGAILALHGAMATETSEDPEGDLIAAVRDVLGPALPIIVSFDMHCHLTEQKLRAADAIVGYHTHPHVDFVDTGMRAMRIMARTIRGEVRPVLAQRKIRMLTSAEHHNTSRPPMAEVFARVAAMEREPGVLAATIFATQPWMDVADLGWSAVVVADGDRGLAQACADELAGMVWTRRERYLVRKTPIAEAIRHALAGAEQPFVFADSSDSVTGGAYGDGNALLRALLETGYGDTALLTLTDPEAAAACHAAGVGNEICLAVGGKLAPTFYRPVTVTGRVRTLTDGKYVCELPATPIDVGHAAVLQVGGMSLALSERPAPTIDQAFYRHLGLDPRAAKIVQVKSPGGFRAVYGPFAAGIFEIDTPGPTDSELTRLPFRKIRRPLWPFDLGLSEPW